MKKEVNDEKGMSGEGRESSVRHATRGIHLPVDEAAAAFLGRRACAGHAQGAPEEIENAREKRERDVRRL